MTEEIAAIAYAIALNTLDPTILEPLVSDEIVYFAEMECRELQGREAFLEYLDGRVPELEGPESRLRAELAETQDFPARFSPPRPCVVLEQGSDLVATVLFSVDARQLQRIEIRATPLPCSCVRSGRYPQ
jgi:hypothetical protein